MDLIVSEVLLELSKEIKTELFVLDYIEPALATNVRLPYEMLQRVRNLSDRELPDNQFRIIFKCRGIAVANRKCETNGLGEKVFLPDWTSIVVNGKELELCKVEDIWICTDGETEGNYISIKGLLSKN